MQALTVMSGLFYLLDWDHGEVKLGQTTPFTAFLVLYNFSQHTPLLYLHPFGVPQAPFEVGHSTPGSPSSLTKELTSRSVITQGMIQMNRLNHWTPHYSGVNKKHNWSLVPF